MEFQTDSDSSKQFYVLLQANMRQLESELDYMSEETVEGRAHIQRIKELIHEKTETLHQRLEGDGHLGFP